MRCLQIFNLIVAFIVLNANVALCGKVLPENSEIVLLEDKNGCKPYEANFKPGYSIEWSGACKNGYLDGNGILKYLKNGVVFQTDEGAFFEGRLNGMGTRNISDEYKYEGGFVENFGSSAKYVQA